MNRELNLPTIIDTLRKILPGNRDFIPLHEPLISGNEWTYVKECLDSGWVSSAGRYVERFEQQLADYTGMKYAVAVVNGTSALHICLQIAPPNAISYWR